MLDGEIVKLDQTGRPVFLDLMRRRGPFCFVAFDLLAVNGRDVRKLPLIKRKRILREIRLRRRWMNRLAAPEKPGPRFFVDMPPSKDE